MTNESNVQSDGGGPVRGSSLRLYWGTASYKREALVL